MGVLLVNPPTLGHLASRGLLGKTSYFEYECSFTSQYWYKSYPGEHVGLMSLVAYLRANDVPVRCVNGQVQLHRTLDQTWAAMLSAGQELGEVDVVGFSGPCQVFDENAELAERAARQWPEARIVLGHHFATLNSRRILEQYPQFDSIALGDGERSIVELAAARGESELATIKGLAWRDSAGNVRTQPQSTTPPDIDELPWMARDEVRAVMKIGVSAVVSTARGCPYRCSYCTTGQTAGLLHKRLGYRERSIDGVLDEIEALVKDYGIPHLTISDDLFVVKTPESYERAIRFAEGYRARGLKVPFMLDCRLDSADPEVFKALAKAGCYRVFMGIETGSTEQLSFYNKHYGSSFDVPYVRRRVGALQSYGIEVIPGILTFHPATTHQELRQTLEVIDACGYESTWQFLCDVFAHPGTTLYRRYQKEGWLTNDWPIPSWSFQDPAAEEVRSRVLAVVGAGGGHAQARAAFDEAVTAWENGKLLALASDGAS